MTYFHSSGIGWSRYQSLSCRKQQIVIFHRIGKWTTKNTGSPTCKRGFVQFCYEPIKQIINTCMNDQKDKLWPMLQKLGVTMKSEEWMGKALMKGVMQTWLPASILEMMILLSIKLKLWSFWNIVSQRIWKVKRWPTYDLWIGSPGCLFSDGSNSRSFGVS